VVPGLLSPVPGLKPTRFCSCPSVGLFNWDLEDFVAWCWTLVLLGIGLYNRRLHFIFERSGIVAILLTISDMLRSGILEYISSSFVPRPSHFYASEPSAQHASTANRCTSWGTARYA